MFWIVKPKMNDGDSAVTGQYIQIIQKAIEKIGKKYQVCSPEQTFDKKKDTIIVVDCLQAFSYILRGFRNVMFWSQGVVPEESYMRNRSKVRLVVWNFIEYIALKYSKFVFLCSKEMKRHYESKYKLELTAKSCVMPCFNEKDINEDAFFDGKYDANSFLYVGSLKAWQCFKEIIYVYKKIEQKSGFPVKLYVYTGQKEEAEKAIKEAGIENYYVGYAKPTQLAQCIRSIKYGFVIRENVTVNQVATPTKLSNYLANGIIPIYSSCISDFNSQDMKYRTGIVCDVDATDEGVERILGHMKQKIEYEKMREKCKEWFADYYSVDRYIQKIASALKKCEE